VASCGLESVVLVKDGKQRHLPLAHAKSFNLYAQKELVLAEGDSVRITKNFRAGAKQFRNNELCTVTAIARWPAQSPQTRLGMTELSCPAAKSGAEQQIEGQNDKCRAPLFRLEDRLKLISGAEPLAVQRARDFRLP
jgi:hypothetical protein